MKENILDELNENQREAVTFIDGPSLVIAGAGSGKTRVLTYKIAYLLSKGVEPYRILALTFTNKASKEMKERIDMLVGGNKARYLWMGTFHSVFYRILRAEAAAIGFKSNFTIYDASDAKSLVKSIIKDMQLDDKVYKASSVVNRISWAKNMLLTPEEYASDADCYLSDKAQHIPAVRDIYRIYAMRCRASEVMDFDDLLLYTYKLFISHPDICRNYSERFEYILVDEYQDTNLAQHRILFELAKVNKRICAVGDDAQSIYGFRGADIDNILQFCNRYDGARLFKLEQNYRSTQNIVNAAGSVILHNKGQIKKEVFSQKEAGSPLQIFSAYSDIEEGEIVCNQIAKQCREAKLSFRDVAILYRTNAQSRIFEEALRKRAIPYRIYGGLSFYQRKEVKDVIAYFRLTINPNDEEAFKRVINYPKRGIGSTTVEKITSAATQAEVGIWQVMENPESFGVSVNKGTAQKLAAFASLISSFGAGKSNEDASLLSKRIVRETGIMADLFKDNSPEGQNRVENVTELIGGIETFVEQQNEEDREDQIFMEDYMQRVSLLTDTDKTDDDTPKVTLMTIHSAKGLEFSSVFIVGMEEGLFPGSCAVYDAREKEEERRLFYVAITRAKEYCTLSYSKSRYRYGKMEFAEPSSFLAEIDSRYVNKAGGKASNKFAEKQRTMDAADIFSHPIRQTPKHFVPLSSGFTDKKESKKLGERLSVGMQIEHERFGIGEIVNLEGAGENSKATVKFQNAGEKTLLLKFARFKTIAD